MRRTDFPQGVPGHFGVASFVWDATEDGALVAGGTVLRGEIPTGSILIGGFLHVSVALAAAVNLKLDNQVLLAASATTVGYQVLTLGQLGDPTKNLVIATTARSRLTASGAIATGQFAVYLFYVNNDLGEFGQATTPTLYKRSKSPLALPSEIKVASFVWDAATDGALLAGGSLLRGEIPSGSVLIGGFLHIATVLAAAVNLKLDDQVLLAASATAVGQYALTLGMFSDQTKNVLISTEARSRVTATGAIATGQFALYLFYVNNDLGEYGNLKQPRHTEAPEARPGEIRLATFVWNADDHGPLPVGINRLFGEIPKGSIVFGGFFQIGKTIFPPGAQGVWLSSGPDQTNRFHAADAQKAVGMYALNSDRALFLDPTKNFLVNTDSLSRWIVWVESAPLTAGQFCLYMFYINNELGLHGQITSPHSSQIT